MGAASWVVVSKQTGKAIMETFSRKVANAVNTNRYRVVPIGKWLASLNQKNAT